MADEHYDKKVVMYYFGQEVEQDYGKDYSEPITRLMHEDFEGLGREDVEFSTAFANGTMTLSRSKEKLFVNPNQVAALRIIDPGDQSD